MSDANRVSVGTALETIYAGRDPVTGALTPTTSGFAYQRITSESLERSKDTIMSEEIRFDRQVSAIPQVDIGARGSLIGEVAYAGPTDDMWCAALMADGALPAAATFTVKGLVTGLGGNCTVTPNGSTVIDETTYAVTSGSFETLGIQEGSIIRISGFADPPNNGWKLVKRVGPLFITVTGFGTGVVAPAGTYFFEVGDEMLTGTTVRSLAIEKIYNDISSVNAKYHKFTGMMVDRWMIECELGRISRWTFDFLGANMSMPTAQSTAPVPNTPFNYTSLNNVDNFKAISSNGVDLMAITLEVRNAARPRGQMGTLGKVAAGIGRVAVTGSIRQYFANLQALERFLDHLSISFGFALVQVGAFSATPGLGGGCGFGFGVPNARVTGWRAVAGGIDQDLIAEIGFTAIQYVPSTLQATAKPFRTVNVCKLQGKSSGAVTLRDEGDEERRFSTDMQDEAAHNVEKLKQRKAEMAADRKHAA